ncbi:hypothetical protein KZ483_27060 [Paenibacillus sp. sptzw28]|uniref:hypothetical protein n=1 Tax=Paenibacillus sp. sptzw28 TaxID=715179 RepID=UPI001C6F14D1|nr:hypothetical protein [Paenibacillus sp. sptzw28]QYR21298.1 hypothetical protein KZ483_27060 [Paenibacillus sp. sptzw28]
MDIDFYRKWACQKMIESSQSNMWEGHWACAVIALTNLLEEKLAPPLMEDLIRKNLEKIVDEHANEQQYRVSKEYDGFAAQMMRLLVQNHHTCHALGHDVIYTYYLLSTLLRSIIPASVELFDAMEKIVRSFASSGPGFVTVNGENIVIDPNGIPNTGLRLQLTPETVLDLFHNFQRPLRMEKGDMQLGHILTHGHAIVELKQAYCNDVHDNFDPAFYARINILTYANTLEQNRVEANSAFTVTELNPLKPSYWEQALAESRHGHHYKYAYSYLRLCRMSGRSPSDFRSFQRIL